MNWKVLEEWDSSRARGRRRCGGKLKFSKRWKEIDHILQNTFAYICTHTHGVPYLENQHVEWRRSQREITAKAMIATE